MARFAVVVHDPDRQWDYLTIGPFNDRDEAQAEAQNWRSPTVRAMIRYLWDGDDLRRDMERAAEQATKAGP